MVGGVHGRGACVAGGVRGRGMHGGVHVAGGHAWRGGMPGIQSMSGRYASYWNAFLLFYASENPSRMHRKLAWVSILWVRTGIRN